MVLKVYEIPSNHLGRVLPLPIIQASRTTLLDQIRNVGNAATHHHHQCLLGRCCDRDLPTFVGRLVPLAKYAKTDAEPKHLHDPSRHNIEPIQ